MAKRKHPLEVFGHPVDVDTEEAQRHREEYGCPFVGQVCDKQSRLIDFPMGVCSVQYGGDVIALCPRRFLQGNIVFYDIADHYFGSRDNLLIFPEVSIPGARNLGVFDFVMVKHKPLSSDVEDFVAVEFQTGQTTGTGALVEGFKDYMHGQSVEEGNYSFGLNLADIWKRTFTQVLTEGIVMERWGHRIYWVLQEPIYQDFLDRYRLHGLTYQQEHRTVFSVYDLQRDEHSYQLCRSRVESSTVDDLFTAFRTNLQVPPKHAFVDKLSGKIHEDINAGIDLHLVNS